MKLKLLGILFVACLLSGCYGAQETDVDKSSNMDLDEQKSEIKIINDTSEGKEYRLKSDLPNGAIFHTFRLKNGRVRQFCNFVPKWNGVGELPPALGILEQDADTVWPLKINAELTMSSDAPYNPLKTSVASDGHMLFIACPHRWGYDFYGVDCQTLAIHLFTKRAWAIRATKSGYVVSESRISNLDENPCCAEYEFAFHDIVIDMNGNVLKNDSTHEYDLDALERRFNSNDVYPVVGFSSTF